MVSNHGGRPATLCVYLGHQVCVRLVLCKALMAGKQRTWRPWYTNPLELMHCSPFRHWESWSVLSLAPTHYTIDQLYIRDSPKICTNVAVSCVPIHVLINSTPDFQSRKPAFVSSWGLGGIETLSTIVPVVVAPSMRDPPRKQTKWSCFGVSRHDLINRPSILHAHWLYHYSVSRTFLLSGYARVRVRRCMSFELWNSAEWDSCELLSLCHRTSACWYSSTLLRGRSRISYLPIYVLSLILQNRLNWMFH